jgi:hypothetical protein
MSTPICPLLSDSASTCLCVEEQCAFYLQPVKKCAAAVLGLHAMMQAQQLQQPKAPTAKPV